MVTTTTNTKKMKQNKNEINEKEEREREKINDKNEAVEKQNAWTSNSKGIDDGNRVFSYGQSQQNV